MTTEADSDAGKEIEIETGFGKLKTKGYHLGNVLQIVAGILLALLLFMVYEMRGESKAMAAMLSNSSKDTVAALSVASKSEHDQLSTVLNKLAEQQEITNFLFTLAPADREKLNIRMPDGLRRRIMDR